MLGVTSIRLQPEVQEPLENLSKKLDRSKNYFINQAIKIPFLSGRQSRARTKPRDYSRFDCWRLYRSQFDRLKRN